MKTLNLKTVCFLAAIIVSAMTNFVFAQPQWDMPQIIHLPDNSEKYTLESRRFTGIPSMAVSSGGRMWATWYTGSTPKEDHNNYVVLTTSGDGGKTWEEVMIIDPDVDGPLRAFDSQLWIAPDNSLYFFYAIGGRRFTADPVDTWFIKTNDPDNKSPAWSAQRFLANGVMMNKPTVLSSGEWLLPVALWSDIRNDATTDNSAKVYVSRDNGATFSFAGACNVPVEARNFDEHQLVERKDGSLLMLVRTTYGIGESVSTDGGKTWSELRPSKIKNPAARFFITRLVSGNLLLVKNGPVDLQTQRSHIMAFISTDDGNTWSRGLLLDEGGEISYPDGQQTKDGMIHIIWDYNRYAEQMIRITNFTEADILDPHHDMAIVRVFNNRKIVSKK